MSELAPALWTLLEERISTHSVSSVAAELGQGNSGVIDLLAANWRRRAAIRAGHLG